MGILDPKPLTKTTGDTAYVPKWKPNTTYAAGDPVVNPSGDVVTAKAAFTSGSSYSAANWNPSTTLMPRVFNGAFSGASDGVNITDTGASINSSFRLTDTAANAGSIINLHHWGNVAGQQSYGLNIANHTGASNAFTIHQYSWAAPAVQIDNTDIGTAIYIKNTFNNTENPGRTGTGAFVQFMPYGQTDSLFLTDNLVWNNLTTKDMRIVGQYASQYALNVETATDSRALYVSKQGTGTGSALDVLNKGTGSGINLVQQGAGTGVNITMTDTTVAKYGIFLNAKQYGVYFKTDTDGGTTLDIDKTSTGNGTAAKIRNLGTGDTLSFVNASGQVARFSAGGEYENLALGGGILVKSPGGTRYRIAVNNSGVVTATAA